MPPSSWDAARSASSVRLTQRATVYSPDPVSGRWTTVAKRSLPCRLVSPRSTGSALPTYERAELMAGRDFWWEPSYFLPETAQILVDGVMWAVRAGTFQALGDCELPAARRCMVVRQAA